MRTDEDTDRLLRSWFEGGPVRTRDDVLEALEARLAHEPQRAGLVVDGRVNVSRLATLSLAAGGAAVLLVAAVSLSTWRGESPNVGGAPAFSPSVPSTQPAPSALSAASPSPAAPHSAPVAREAGTFQSRRFRVPLTYTVPDGWWKSGEDPSALSLSAGEPNNPTTTIEIVYDAFPPLVDDAGCQQRIDWDRPHGVDDLLQYWESRPEIAVREREPVSIGGLDGWRAVIAAPDGGCDTADGDRGANAFVVRWHDGIPVTLGISGDTELVALQDRNETTLVIQVNAWADDPTELAEADQIVQSFVFEQSADEEG